MGGAGLHSQAVARLSTAIAADDGVAIVVGAPGTGKTTLVRETLRAGERPVVWVTGVDALRTIPFGALAGALDVEPAPDLAAALTRAHAALKRALGASGVLVLDDCDRLDDATAALVGQVLDRREVPVVLIGPALDAFPSALRARAGAFGVPVIELHDLDVTQSAVFLSGRRPGGVADPSVRALHRASGGNLLLLSRLDLAAERGGLWHRADAPGLWYLTAVPQARDVAWRFASYLNDLAPATVRVVGLAAAAGQLDREDLERLGVVDDVGPALRTSLVQYDADRHVLRPRHPVVEAAVTEAMGEWAMTLWRGEVVAARADRPVDAAGLLALADMSLRSSVSLPVERLVDAAWLALTFGALDPAVRFATAAVARDDSAPSLLALAEAQAWGGDPATARATYDRIDPVELPSELRLTWRTASASHAFWAEGDVTHAHAILDRAASGNPPVVDAVACAFAAFEGKARLAIELGEPVLDRGDSPTATVWAATGVSLASSVVFAPARQARAAARGLEAADYCPSGLQAWSFYHDSVVMQLATGALEEARRTVADATARAAGQPVVEAISQSLYALVTVESGALDRALGGALSAWSVLQELAPRGWACWGAIVAARVAAVAGDAWTAARLAEEARARFGAEVAVYEPLLLTAEGWAAWAQGRVSAARAAFAAACRDASSRGATTYELDALLSAWRTGIPVPPSPTPRRLAERSLAARVLVAASRGDAALAACAADVLERGYEVLAAEISESVGPCPAPGPGERFAERRPAPWGDHLPSTLVRRRSNSPLSPREREIAEAVRRGLSNAAIAEELGISVRTVEGHVLRATEKLGVQGRTGLRRATHL